MESPEGSGESDSRLDLLGFAGTPFLGEFGAVLDILDLGKEELEVLGRLEAVEKEELEALDRLEAFGKVELEVLGRLEAVEKEELEALGRLEAFGKVELEALDKNFVALVVLVDVYVIFHLRSYLHDWIHMNIFFHEFHRLIRVQGSDYVLFSDPKTYRYPILLSNFYLSHNSWIHNYILLHGWHILFQSQDLSLDWFSKDVHSCILVREYHTLDISPAYYPSQRFSYHSSQRSSQHSSQRSSYHSSQRSCMS